MNLSSNHSASVNPRRLFVGMCLAIIPTGASFVFVSNIFQQLKTEFILTNAQVGYIGGGSAMGDGPLPSSGGAFSGEDRIEKSNGGCILRAPDRNYAFSGRRPVCRGSLSILDFAAGCNRPGNWYRTDRGGRESVDSGSLPRESNRKAQSFSCFFPRWYGARRVNRMVDGADWSGRYTANRALDLADCHHLYTGSHLRFRAASCQISQD